MLRRPHFHWVMVLMVLLALGSLVIAQQPQPAQQNPSPASKNPQSPEKQTPGTHPV